MSGAWDEEMGRKTEWCINIARAYISKSHDTRLRKRLARTGLQVDVSILTDERNGKALYRQEHWRRSVFYVPDSGYESSKQASSLQCQVLPKSGICYATPHTYTTHPHSPNSHPIPAPGSNLTRSSQIRHSVQAKWNTQVRYSFYQVRSNSFVPFPYLNLSNFSSPAPTTPPPIQCSQEGDQKSKIPDHKLGFFTTSMVFGSHSIRRRKANTLVQNQTRSSSMCGSILLHARTSYLTHLPT